jgi:hypothetical protein
MSEQGAMRPSYTLAFRLAALVAMGIAIYHSVAFFYPAIGKVAYGAAYFSGYPARRHLFWAVTFASLTGLLLWRPRWLIWPYLILVAQQLNGHGGAIWRHWVQDGFISRGDMGALTSELLILLLLILDWRARRSRTKQDIQ